jgi:hypothetical protein
MSSSEIWRRQSGLFENIRPGDTEEMHEKQHNVLVTRPIFEVLRQDDTTKCFAVHTAIQYTINFCYINTRNYCR